MNRKRQIWIGRIMLVLSLVAIFGMAITSMSQDKPADAVELKEIDRLKMENLMLSISNLQLQMQAIQRDGQRATSDLKALREGLFSQYDLSPDDWTFSDSTMKFERKKKP